MEDLLFKNITNRTKAEIIDLTENEYNTGINKLCEFRIGNYSIVDLSNMDIMKVSLDKKTSNNINYNVMSIQFLHSHISGGDIAILFTNLFNAAKPNIPKTNKCCGYYYLIPFLIKYLSLIISPKPILYNLIQNDGDTPQLIVGSFKLPRIKNMARATAILKTINVIREATNDYTNTFRVGLTCAFSGGDKKIINNVGIILLNLHPSITAHDISILLEKTKWHAVASNLLINSNVKSKSNIRDYVDIILSMSYFKIDYKCSDIYWTTSRIPSEPIYVGTLSQITDTDIYLDISITSGKKLAIPNDMVLRDYNDFATIH